METASKLARSGAAERETIRRALHGDTGAFEEVIAFYSRRLYAVAYGALQNATEAEDVVQETFLKAYARRWLIRDPDKFPAWLCRTTRNRACDLVRRRSNEAHPEENRETEVMEIIADASVPCPSANLRATERNGAVHRLLNTLPENHRIAVTLRFMEGMEYEEIQQAMGVSNGALRGILARAMKTLRKGVGTALLPDLTGVS
jgi:RNA polymerase sigma-70 factor (ECF subfamily)